MAAVVTKAEQQDIGDYFIGVDSNITLAMDPVVDTTGWTVCFELALTLGGANVLSLTTALGDITTGGGDDDEEILIDLASADFASLTTKTYWYRIRRTDSGQKDILAFGLIDLVYPDAAA